MIQIGLIGAEGRLGRMIASMHPTIPILRHTSRLNLSCDVLIDVSSPLALSENLSAKKPIVIGTTGQLDRALLEKTAKHLPIFYAPNFSLGVAILKKICAEVGRFFPADIDIIEAHHKEKKDAPSGTALMLAEELPNSCIHSIRAGKIFGEHTVQFTTGQERLTFKHEALSREAYAKGAIMAAHYIYNKPAGLYTMDDLLK